MFPVLTARAVGYLTDKSFGEVSASVGDMIDQDLPQVTVSQNLIQAIKDAKDAMMHISIAETTVELASASAQAKQAATSLSIAVEPLPEDRLVAIHDDTTQVIDQLLIALAARESAFETSNQVMAMVADLQNVGT